MAKHWIEKWKSMKRKRRWIKLNPTSLCSERVTSIYRIKKLSTVVGRYERKKPQWHNIWNLLSLLFINLCKGEKSILYIILKNVCFACFCFLFYPRFYHGTKKLWLQHSAVQVVCLWSWPCFAWIRRRIWVYYSGMNAFFKIFLYFFGCSGS